MNVTRIAAVAAATTLDLAAPGVIGSETPRAQAKPEGLTIRHLDTRLLADDLEFGGQRVGGLSGIAAWQIRRHSTDWRRSPCTGRARARRHRLGSRTRVCC